MNALDESEHGSKATNINEPHNTTEAQGKTEQESPTKSTAISIIPITLKNGAPSLSPVLSKEMYDLCLYYIDFGAKIYDNRLYVIKSPATKFTGKNIHALYMDCIYYFPSLNSGEFIKVPAKPATEENGPANSESVPLLTLSNYITQAPFVYTKEGYEACKLFFDFATTLLNNHEPYSIKLLNFIFADIHMLALHPICIIYFPDFAFKNFIKDPVKLAVQLTKDELYETCKGYFDFVALKMKSDQPGILQTIKLVFSQQNMLAFYQRCIKKFPLLLLSELAIQLMKLSGKFFQLFKPKDNLLAAEESSDTYPTVLLLQSSPEVSTRSIISDMELYATCTHYFDFEAKLNSDQPYVTKASSLKFDKEYIHTLYMHCISHFPSFIADKFIKVDSTDAHTTVPLLSSSTEVTRRSLVYEKELYATCTHYFDFEAKLNSAKLYVTKTPSVKFSEKHVHALYIDCISYFPSLISSGFIKVPGSNLNLQNTLNSAASVGTERSNSSSSVKVPTDAHAMVSLPPPTIGIENRSIIYEKELYATCTHYFDFEAKLNSAKPYVTKTPSVKFSEKHIHALYIDCISYFPSLISSGFIKEPESTLNLKNTLNSAASVGTERSNSSSSVKVSTDAHATVSLLPRTIGIENRRIIHEKELYSTCTHYFDFEAKLNSAKLYVTKTPSLQFSEKQIHALYIDCILYFPSLMSSRFIKVTEESLNVKDKLKRNTSDGLEISNSLSSIGVPTVTHAPVTLLAHTTGIENRSIIYEKELYATCTHYFDFEAKLNSAKPYVTKSPSLQFSEKQIHALYIDCILYFPSLISPLNLKNKLNSDTSVGTEGSNSTSSTKVPTDTHATVSLLPHSTEVANMSIVYGQALYNSCIRYFDFEAKLNSDKPYVTKTPSLKFSEKHIHAFYIDCISYFPNFLPVKLTTENDSVEGAPIDLKSSSPISISLQITETTSHLIAPQIMLANLSLASENLSIPLETTHAAVSLLPHSIEIANMSEMYEKELYATCIRYFNFENNSAKPYVTKTPILKFSEKNIHAFYIDCISYFPNFLSGRFIEASSISATEDRPNDNSSSIKATTDSKSSSQTSISLKMGHVTVPLLTRSIKIANMSAAYEKELYASCTDYFDFYAMLNDDKPYVTKSPSLKFSRKQIHALYIDCISYFPNLQLLRLVSVLSNKSKRRRYMRTKGARLLHTRRKRRQSKQLRIPFEEN